MTTIAYRWGLTRVLARTQWWRLRWTFRWLL